MTGQRDPTQSAGLRSAGRAAVARRVYELNKQLRQTVQEHDVVGLRQRELVPEAHMMFIEGNGGRVERVEPMLRRIVEEVLVAPPDWLRNLIGRAVRAGVEQVGRELKEDVEFLDPREVIALHAKAAEVEVDGISSETQRRILRGVVRALEMRQTPEQLMREMRALLRKVTKLRLNLLVNTSVVRAVNAGKLFGYEANGVTLVGIDPEWLPHTHDSVSLHDREDPKKKKRKPGEQSLSGFATAGGIALVAVIEARRQRKRSFTIAQLRAARKKPGTRRQRMRGLPNIVNVLTAGDDKVCQDCQDISDNGPYDLDEARELLPAHPNCRCAVIPWDDRRYAMNR